LLKCEKTCGNSAYAKDYSDDKTKASSAFSVRSVSQMQQVLSSNGPLAVAFTVYADFPTYKSGVYTHTTGGELGGHAVSMQGWGVENGVKYWLVKNSWTDKWGDKGYFKIKRGVDECGIEDDVTGTKHSSGLTVV
jgi:cathepsin B